MRFKQAILKIRNKYLDKSLDARIQVFNLLMVTGIISGILVGIAALILKNCINAATINVMISALSFVLLCVAEKKKLYHLCSWIYVIIAFFILFPFLYFLFGGYRSGALNLFLVAWVFTSLLLDKFERVFTLVLELNIYVLCFLTEYYRPGIAAELASNFEYTLLMFLNFIYAGVVLLTTISVRARIFTTKQYQEKELNRELAARAETLAQYDRMKSDFLSTVAHEINTPLAIIAASSNDTLDLLDEPTLSIR